jgi:hypothetical protein
MTDAEDQLRHALDLMADSVHASPDAYQHVQREWRRRERRRRLTLYTLIAVVFLCTDLLGLWALNQAHTEPHILNPPTTAQPLTP